MRTKINTQRCSLPWPAGPLFGEKMCRICDEKIRKTKHENERHEENQDCVLIIERRREQHIPGMIKVQRFGSVSLTFGKSRRPPSRSHFRFSGFFRIHPQHSFHPFFAYFPLRRATPMQLRETRNVATVSGQK